MSKSEVKKPKKIIGRTGKRGGARPGAGMPKGKKLHRTLERERVEREYKQKIMRQADKLFQTQSVLAFGSYVIYLVEHYEDIDGKLKSRKVLVEDPETIENVLNDPDMMQGDNYYVVQTVPPSEKTLTDMLDRAFGRPTQSVVTESEDGKRKPLQGVISL